MTSNGANMPRSLLRGALFDFLVFVFWGEYIPPKKFRKNWVSGLLSHIGACCIAVYAYTSNNIIYSQLSDWMNIIGALDKVYLLN